MTLVTPAEFARQKKVSRAAITQWKARGRLVMVGKLIDVEKTQEKLLQGSGHRAKGRLSPLSNSLQQLNSPGEGLTIEGRAEWASDGEWPE